MILAECREGDQVVYIPQHMEKHASSIIPGNTGVIHSVNDRYVFVLYHYDLTARATNPAQLHRLDDFYKKK